MTETKSCPKCGVVKLASEFYANKSKSDGLSAHCKDCAREWREANHDHLIAYNRKGNAERRRETKRVATKLHTRWTDDDIAELMRTDISLLQISKNLGRTYGAASVRRTTLRERAERLAIIEAKRPKL